MDDKNTRRTAEDIISSIQADQPLLDALNTMLGPKAVSFHGNSALIDRSSFLHLLSKWDSELDGAYRAYMERLTWLSEDVKRRFLENLDKKGAE